MSSSSRIQSVDYLRGLVMILMAIDHVRVYSGVPAESAEVAYFFTRWITHFCAPAFVFFAGTSAYLYGTKTNKSELTKFLLTRGLILVVLELTVIRFLWAFHVSTDFILMGVIWMLGWCMILLTLFIRLSPRVIGNLGILIIFSQTLFLSVPRVLPETWQAGFERYWKFIYAEGYPSFDGINILYVIVPWIGVMAAGYAFGSILQMDEQQKKKYCFNIGATLTILFPLLAMFTYTQYSEKGLPFFLGILQQEKYPPSIIFLMMTLGPIILLVPYADRAKGWLRDVFVTIGKVPFFYYLLHILVIHLSALVVNYFRVGEITHDWYLTAPYTWFEDQKNVWPLPLLYFIFLIDVVVLYFACKWYGKFKSKHPENRLLRYI